MTHHLQLPWVRVVAAQAVPRPRLRRPWPTHWSPSDVVADPQLEEQFPLAVAFCPDCALVQITEDVAAREAVRRQLPLLLVVLRPSAAAQPRPRARPDRDRAVSTVDHSSSKLASNDGYLLKNFVDDGIPAIGFDPAPDQAEAARSIGVDDPAKSSSVSRLRTASARRARSRRCDHRQQRDGPHPRPERLRRRHGPPARRRRR